MTEKSLQSRVFCRTGTRYVQPREATSDGEGRLQLTFDYHDSLRFAVGDRIDVLLEDSGDPEPRAAVVCSRSDQRRGIVLDVVMMETEDQLPDSLRGVVNQRRSSRLAVGPGFSVLVVVPGRESATPGQLIELSETGAGVLAHRSAERILAGEVDVILSIHAHKAALEVNLDSTIRNRRLTAEGIQYGFEFLKTDRNRRGHQQVHRFIQIRNHFRGVSEGSQVIPRP